ncbi:MAG: efflux RND transporter periplasmic adaptor subunit [Candidatus Andeanibacterium colombiense]|uniref:Efflux RND transporter periplasmic adaptor subunit n=1 Tax=Candidatus Andeanibacterium colombiense TaxID=3121345 RepID=A0AAJ5X7W5_9SPHN|nr:MAG: efflux RND transporter periplasmic adaptor subunit [Sphingomonadaceae bacterium]
MSRFFVSARLGCALMLGALALPGCSSGNESTVAATAALTVQAVKPQILTWPRQLTANGALAAWQEAVISAETGSYRIASINADVGTWTHKGQVLATLARDSLQADRARLQATLAEAEANLSKAASDVARARQVGDSGALSAQQIESYQVTQRTAQATVAAARAQLRSTDIQLGQTSIRAVDDGVVSSRSALLGKVVSSGEELFRMVRQGRIEWQAELDAQQLALVRAGQSARVTLPDGQIVEGTVRLVAPTLSTTTSRGIAYVQLPPRSAARAGMYGSGVIETDSFQTLTLPDSAVVLRDGKSYVYVIGRDSTVKQRAVTTGQRRAGRIAVSGISANADVVETGGAFLSDGVSVRVERGAKK